ncbi:MAG: molybdopterin-dependent oxidoreductase [Ancalomicrobiaceae bacterium]|nr:molybdopterin-dependent oxidoreductase [Ancalomicrobiaceae bacterium]
MDERYACAHWGSYVALGDREALRLEPVADDPAPSVIGEGWVGAVRDAGSRIRRPAIRRGWLDGRDRSNRNDDSFVEVGWDEALDIAAAELRRVIDVHGNRAIFGGSYGWASAGRFHHAQSQLKRFLNTVGGCVSAVDTYSHATGEVLLPHITGMSNRQFQDEMNSWPLLAEHCQLLVCFGGISGRTAQVMSSGTSRHEVDGWLQRIHAAGARIVTISPNRTDMAAGLAPEWIAPRPNTDTALMIGLAYALIETDRVDRGFLARYTVGWDHLEAYLTGRSDGVAKSPEWAAGITGLAAASIRALAADMASNRTMISVAWGIQRADHGEQPLWMGLALAAMLGGIGTPGGGFAFGYGSTTPVGRPGNHVNWPSLAQGHNPVKDFIPVARISDLLLDPGGSFTYDGATHRYPDIRLVYWVGGNPFHHHQDLNRLAAAWTRPETVIVNEIWWTATARRADIVFPVCSPLERADIMMNRRDPALIFMQKLLPAYGESRSDYDVYCGLAKRLGTLAAFSEGRDEEGWLRHLWSAATAVAAKQDIALPDFAAFRAMGRFDCPRTDTTRLQFGAFIEDPVANPLATPSGRIELNSQWIADLGLADCPGHPVWLEPAEWLGQPGADGMLHLVSGQPLTRLHSQLDSGPRSRSSKIRGREPVYLNPETARRHGIGDGDIVLLSNRRGRCLAGAVLTGDIRPDIAWLATGAWFDPQRVDGELIDVHGNPNTLTLDKGCSGLSQGNAAHTTLVRIERWTGQLPPLTVFSQPRFAAR